MSLLSIFSTIFGGGITGLAGTAIQRFFEFKKCQLDIQMQTLKNSQEIELKKVDAQIMEQEWASRTKVAESESASKEDVADTEAFSKALTSEPIRYSDSSKTTPGQEFLMVMLDLVRGLVRPLLTLYLCGLTTAVYFQSKALLGNQTLGVDQAAGLVTSITDTILYLTVTCVSFWFGTRNKDRKPKI